MTTRRALIYCRISSDREGAGLGVATQEADGRELAEKLGWSVVAVYTDNDLSAYSGKPRPGYKALLADLESGRADAVLVWHTDRLHRSPVELEAYVDLCERMKVATQTCKAGELDLATPSGRLVARQLGSVARYEVEHSVERMRRAKLRSATSGTWKGGRRPFGYQDDGMTVIKAEAQLLAEGSTEILSGASLGGIAHRWNERGSVTTTGKPWTASAVGRVLTRPRNAGLMEHQGKVVGSASWPAIVPEQQWRAVAGILADPGRRTSPGNARRWLGSGIYRCGVCSGPVIATTNGNAKQIGYRCRDGGHVNRTAEDVDEYVRATIAARLRRPDLADLLAGHAEDPAAFEALRVEALALRARLDELAGLFADGDIDALQLTEGTRKINAALADIERAQAASVRVSALDGMAAAPDPGLAFLKLPLDRQRAVVAALATITLLPGGKGRPAGWKAGESYFRPESVDIVPREAAPSDE
jgi:site-specific DNA recombinase